MRIGIVGCGSVANEEHLPTLVKMEDVEVVAVCDEVEDTVIKTAERFGIDNHFSDLTSMLEKQDMDVVDICVPPQNHAALAVEAMNAGYHVIVEKPMAVTTEEADKMIDASKRNNVKLSVIHNLLFNPLIMEAKSLVESGAVGDLLGVDIKWPVHAPPNKSHWTYTLPGKTIGETLSHPIYLMLAFLHNVNEVRVFKRKLRGNDLMPVDEVKIILNAENGIGTISLSANLPVLKAARTIDIIGTEAALHGSIYTATLIKHKFNNDSSISMAMDNISSSFQLLKETASASLRALRKFPSSHQIIIHRIINNLLNNKEPPVSLEEARETIRITEIICKEIESQ
ncbi:hypothetical protein DRN97_04475 [Methanosarcinales archaeon]|nr:MAG: hypothetical protein DRN97_04475 [Methanosarcinales archaeon]